MLPQSTANMVKWASVAQYLISWTSPHPLPHLMGRKSSWTSPTRAASCALAWDSFSLASFKRFWQSEYLSHNILVVKRAI